MRKITVRDNLKEFHTFKGDDIAFFTNDTGAEIVQWETDEDGMRKHRKLAFFATGQYMWVKEDQGAAPIPARAPYNPTPSSASPHGLLGPTKDSDPFTEAAMSDEIPPAPDFGSLKKDPNIVIEPKGAPDKNSPEFLGAVYTALKAKKKQSRKKAPPATKGKEMTDLVEHAAPVLPDDTQHNDDELFPDPDKVIGEAEARYNVSKHPPAILKGCNTCHGSGLVRDPQSNDPLDTMICPDC